MACMASFIGVYWYCRCCMSFRNLTEVLHQGNTLYANITNVFNFTQISL